MAQEIKALVVDDEPSVRLALEMALAESGWKVDCAESAEEAFQKYQLSAYDVVLSDKNLPGMSGVELIRKAREDNPELCLVMITGYASIESAIETMQLGVDGYIEKPFDDIFSVVRKVKTLQRRCEQRNREAAGETKSAGGPAPDAATEKVRVVLAVPSLPERSWLGQRCRRGTTEIIEVASSLNALHAIKAASAELLIVDASLNNPAVPALVEEVKVLQPKLAVIVVTDKPALKDMIRYIDLKVKSILERPFSDEKFQKKIGLVLDILESNQRQRTARAR